MLSIYITLYIMPDLHQLLTLLIVANTVTTLKQVYDCFVKKYKHHTVSV